ncbi:MAG: hypothetical protein PHF46_04465, partial [Candidatus Gracilibacteria bacterium]|nr:hypothetical protein [Candidatus Gracilibacteria bacterium]
MAILLKTFLLIITAYFFIGEYYGISFHKESSSGYMTYFVMLLVCYGIYKFISLIKKEKKLNFSPLKIGGFALLHIFILCLTFFSFSSSYSQGGGMVLFFKIIGYSFLPFMITIIAYSFGKKILSYIKGFKQEDENFQFLTSLGLGFSVFLFLLCSFGFIGFYNIFTLFGILTVFIILSYKELIESFVSLYAYKIEIDNHNPDGNTFDKINLYLISTEILFIFITFIIGVNLINIVRPMPIGWDDLGVYMNYPKMMGA